MNRVSLPIAVSAIAVQFARSADDTPAKAAQYIAEAKAITARDGGRLWNHPLAGPILLVDPATRAVVASEPDRENRLGRKADVFVGKLPGEVVVANTASNWAGVKWTMLMLPLPADPQRSANLIAHEMWHHVQEEIGFPSSGAANKHLDTRDGRFWLQLEWRALANALRSHDEQQREAVRDALLFRACRRSLFSNAAAEERAMEMHEGLAEYTGVKLSGAPDVAGYVADKNLAEAPAKKTFVRSFAYASGPAYGVLLDRVKPDWRTELRPTDDLGVLLQQASRISLPVDVRRAAEQRQKLYGGEELALAETERDEMRQKTAAEYRATFIEGPVFVLPLRQMQMQFDPGEVVPLEPRGTVYPSIKIVDVWGVLTATNGALLEADFTKVTVAAPDQMARTSVSGNGWTLALQPGWQLERGTRGGDYILKETH